MTDKNYLHQLRKPSPENPLRILMSACLSGQLCAYDGSSYGTYPSALKLIDYPTARVIRFCPEDFSFGTPRETCDIHGGTGMDVLEGKAKVLTESGRDWSEEMIKASLRMLQIATENEIELAVLMDISAACGSQVIYSGSRFAENKLYRIGAGVCAAQLMKQGFKVISQRDYASLEILFSKLDDHHIPNPKALDHHENEWYKSYFGQ